VLIICIALQVYWAILIVRIILSFAQMFAWSPPMALAPAIRVVYDLTEPVLGFIRRYVPPMGGFDLSPIFIFIGLNILQRALCIG